jgi:hypothetical protein
VQVKSTKKKRKQTFDVVVRMSALILHCLSTKCFQSFDYVPNGQQVPLSPSSIYQLRTRSVQVSVKMENASHRGLNVRSH